MPSGFSVLNVTMAYLESLKPTSCLLNTNNEEVYTCNQFIQDMPLPSVCKNVFNPILDRLASNQAGALLDQSLPGKDLSSTVIKVSLLSIGPVRKCVEYARTDSFFTCCGPCSRSNVDANALQS